jgi:hypothetical protein
MGAVPQSVPSAVAPSAGNSVKINQRPQRGPHKPMTGKSYVPAVPANADPEDAGLQPGYGGAGSAGGPPDTGQGAPSVPGMGGVLFTPGPLDVHYQSEVEAYNPYAVNRPAAPGLFTWVKGYLNHIGLGVQNTDTTGFRQTGAQQRTSWMRITPPAHGSGFAPATSTPRQLPQRANTSKYLPSTGTTRPGPVRGQGIVLNSSTFGAGQTAGGIGGNQYTPTPGPPETTSTAGLVQNPGGMPVWG